MIYKKELLLLFAGSLISYCAYAAEPIVQEEVTPPSAEGALTPNQIPPMSQNDADRMPKDNAAPIVSSQNTTTTLPPSTLGVPTPPTPGPNAPATIINNRAPVQQAAEVVTPQPGTVYGPTGGLMPPKPVEETTSQTTTTTTVVPR